MVFIAKYGCYSASGKKASNPNPIVSVSLQIRMVIRFAMTSIKRSFGSSNIWFRFRFTLSFRYEESLRILYIQPGVVANF